MSTQEQNTPTPRRETWGFCETPEEKCTMNYCDDNGCMNRKRHLVIPPSDEKESEKVAVNTPNQ